MSNNRRSGALFLSLSVLLLSAAPLSAEQKSAERNPFEPERASRESRTDSAPVKGVVGDGERWHLWTADKKGRWHKRVASAPDARFFGAISNKDDVNKDETP
ncbi:hypothetical protein [Sodalis sp. dw_96]|uniref:hypothetical protein n=1 Tax=Sodalis sp. dw_96 TaxID=2719794 RepID=UPI001BD3C4DC|nr:hypothetical protein [Sodalis sp. dw_96]